MTRKKFRYIPYLNKIRFSKLVFQNREVLIKLHESGEFPPELDPDLRREMREYGVLKGGSAKDLPPMVARMLRLN